MCNTKNTETIRQQLWCDVYTMYLNDMSHLEASKGASRAVEEFDKNFNNKLNCQGSTIEEMKIEKVEPIIFDLKRTKTEVDEIDNSNQDLSKKLSYRYDDSVRRIKHLDVVLSEEYLKKMFGNNKYYDISMMSDIKTDKVYYAGTSYDGIETVLVCKRA